MKLLQTKKDFIVILIGILIGVGVGLYVPFLNSNSHHQVMNMNSENPYVMSPITSEREFISQMVLHHESAVIMAQDVLKLNPSEKVKKLAEDIISTQSKEIEMMKNWAK